MLVKMKRYTLENKPDFIYGQKIKIDMSFFGISNEIFEGKIVGKSFIHVIDTWLVEFEGDFSPTYPFKVLGVPHTAILQE